MAFRHNPRQTAAVSETPAQSHDMVGAADIDPEHLPTSSGETAGQAPDILVGVQVILSSLGGFRRDVQSPWFLWMLAT